MIFANSYEEQLSLSLFKTLLMFCKADCVCQWEGLNHSPSSSTGAWMHEVGWGMSRFNISQPQETYTVYGNEEYGNKNKSEPTKSFSFIVECETGWSTPKHQHNLGFEYSFKLLLLLFQINVILPLRYCATSNLQTCHTSAWGCIVGLKYWLSPNS